MLNLFVQKYKYDYPVDIHMRLMSVRIRAVTNFTKLESYYKSKDITVSNKNILVKIIKEINIDHELDIHEYIEKITSRVIPVTRRLGITTRVSTGKVLEGSLGTPESKESFLIDDRIIDNIDDLEYTWEELTPMGVLYTNSTDLSMNMPYRQETTFDNYNIYSINPLMLLVKYKYWVEMRRMLGRSINPAYFIVGYVYPGMLKSGYDLAYVNRVFSVYTGETVIPSKTGVHPFYYIDLDHDLDVVINNIVKSLSKKRHMFYELLVNIKCVYQEDAYEVLKFKIFSSTEENRGDIKNNVSTRNIWLILLSRLKYIRYILVTTDKRTLTRERGPIEDFKYFMKQVISNKYMQYVDIPYDIMYDYDTGIYDIDEIIK